MLCQKHFNKKNIILSTPLPLCHMPEKNISQILLRNSQTLLYPSYQTNKEYNNNNKMSDGGRSAACRAACTVSVEWLKIHPISPTHPQIVSTTCSDQAQNCDQHARPIPPPLFLLPDVDYCTFFRVSTYLSLPLFVPDPACKPASRINIAFPLPNRLSLFFLVCRFVVISAPERDVLMEQRHD